MLKDCAKRRVTDQLQASFFQIWVREKSPSQAQRRVSQIREPESCGHAQSVDGGARDERHGTRCLLPKERQEHHGVRVPREQWHETGARESERSVRVASRTCPIQPEYIEELHIRFVFFTFRSGTDQGHDGQV